MKFLLTSLAVAALSQSVQANMYDVVMPAYKSSCKNGCLPWKSAGGGNATLQQIIDAMFVDPDVVDSAANNCAMPAAHAGPFNCVKSVFWTVNTCCHSL